MCNVRIDIIKANNNIRTDQNIVSQGGEKEKIHFSNASTPISSTCERIYDSSSLSHSLSG